MKIKYTVLLFADEALSGPVNVSAWHGEVVLAVEKAINLGQCDETAVKVAGEFTPEGAEELAQALQRASAVAREQAAQREAEESAKAAASPA